MNRLIEALNKNGADTEGALKRFCGNEALYIKYLTSFPQETIPSDFRTAYEAGDRDGAIAHIHNLKGVSGTLGLTAIFSISMEILALLRANEYEKAGELVEPLFKALSEASDIINANA